MDAGGGNHRGHRGWSWGLAVVVTVLVGWSSVGCGADEGSGANSGGGPKTTPKTAIGGAESETTAAELPGRWEVDEPADMASQYAGSILEIRQGPKPALFTGGQVAPATDCPMWGDLRLDATTDPASQPDLRPPAGTALTGAWTGTMTFWCIDNPDTEITAVIGQLDDSRLVLTFPGPEAQVLLLGRHD